jgi:hypothetical protein
LTIQALVKCGVRYFSIPSCVVLTTEWCSHVAGNSGLIQECM